MKIENYYLKFLLAIVLLLGANVGFAQTTTTVTLGIDTNKSYGVDMDDRDGAGTEGSTYEWTILPNGLTLPTVPSTGQYNSVLDDNKITLDWSASPVGSYTIKVVETNETCSAEERLIIVNVVAPSEASGTPSWTDTNICSGGEVTFNISGAMPDSMLNYTLTNATLPGGSVPVGSNGTAVINAIHDGSTNNTVVLTLVSLQLNGATIQYPANTTVTANINIVVTSSIQALD